VQKVEELTDPFSQRLKNVEHSIEKIPDPQVAMKTANTGFIQILGLLFRPILDKNVISILLILCIVCFILGSSVQHMYVIQTLLEGTSALNYRNERRALLPIHIYSKAAHNSTPTWNKILQSSCNSGMGHESGIVLGTLSS
jgi:hypothetical protein